MPTHSLQNVPSCVAEIAAITTDAPSGMRDPRNRTSAARRSPSRFVSAIASDQKARNANVPIAGSAIGMPPQMLARNTDEYGLISAAWQPDVPAVSGAPSPGMIEQWRACVCRSRCDAKSYVDTLAKTSPSTAAKNAMVSTKREFTRGLRSRGATPTIRAVKKATAVDSLRSSRQPQAVPFVLAMMFLTACATSPSDTDVGPRDDGSSDAGALDASHELDATVSFDFGAEDAGAASSDSGATDAHLVDAPSDTSPDASTVVSGLPSVMTFRLDSAPFSADEHPDVAVHVPDGFDLARRPGLVLFFHGWLNCASNVMGSTNTRCSASGPLREALSLVDQFETASVNAILVAAQLRYEAESSNAGRLTEPGLCRAMLRELLRDELSPLFPYDLDVDDLSSVVLAAHSGGYVAMARCLDSGGLTNVRDVQLYDGFYGEYAAYSSYVIGNVERFARGRADVRKFSTVYIQGSGTAGLSTMLASAATTAFDSASLSSELLVDPTTSTFTPDLFETPAIFKRSGLTHYGIPRYYFQRFVAASPLERLH